MACGVRGGVATRMDLSHIVDVTASPKYALLQLINTNLECRIRWQRSGYRILVLGNFRSFSPKSWANMGKSALV